MCGYNTQNVSNKQQPQRARTLRSLGCGCGYKR